MLLMELIEAVLVSLYALLLGGLSKTSGGGRMSSFDTATDLLNERIIVHSCMACKGCEAL
jgi:hypothetical protein